MKHRTLMMVTSISTVFLLTAMTSSSTARLQIGSTISQGGTGFQRKAPTELEPIALKVIAQRHGLRVEDLEVTNSSVAYYRHSNKEAYLFDLEDKNGNDYYVWLNKQGKEISEKQLAKDDQDARLAKYGKLSEELYDYLRNAPSGDEIPVIVLVEMPPDTDKPKDRHPSMDSKKLGNMTDV